MNFYNKLNNNSRLNNNSSSSNNPSSSNNYSSSNNPSLSSSNNPSTNIINANNDISRMNNTNDTNNNISLGVNNLGMNDLGMNNDEIHVKKFKRYIELLNDEHHYFINYKNCYDISMNIIKENNNNNILEFKNNVRLFLSKYKQHKRYELSIELDKIVSMDIKTKKILSKIDLPICVNLNDLYEKERKKLSNSYNKTKLAYNILISRDDIEEDKIEEFKKLREKYNKQVNETYILQFLLNYFKKTIPSNNHFIIHNVQQVYNPEKDVTNTVLLLNNNNIKNELLEQIINEESELLNSFIDIKQKLLMLSEEDKTTDGKKDSTRDNKAYNEIKEDIKLYLKNKKKGEKFINKLYNKKNIDSEVYLYLYPNQIKNLNIHFLNNHYRNITRY